MNGFSRGSVKIDTSKWPVMAKQCSTCVFAMTSRGDWVNPDLAELVESRILSCSQICHSPRLHGKKETHLCRGTRDRQIELMYRMGVISALTDEAWEARRKELGL
jgi:hypothetical protein